MVDLRLNSTRANGVRSTATSVNGTEEESHVVAHNSTLGREQSSDVWADRVEGNTSVTAEKIREAIQTVSEAGWALQTLSPELRRNPAVVLAAVRRDGSALRHASHELRADPTIVMAAVSENGWALKHAHPSLKDDDDIVTAAVSNRGNALQHASDRAKNDFDIVLAAVSTHGDSLEYASPERRANRTLATAAFQNGHERFVLRAVSPDIQRDQPFLESAISMDFYLEKFPDSKPRFQPLLDEADRLGINWLTRMTPRTLQEIVWNRTHLEESDTRPLAVLVYPTSDPKAAFGSFKNIGRLTRGYRVVYYEADSDRAFVRALAESTNRRAADLLVIAGHGTQDDCRFGDADGETAMLDLGDRSLLMTANVGGMLAPSSTIVLDSCSTGRGRDDEENLANMWADLVPHSHIWAPELPTLSRYQLDEQGSFVHPGHTKAPTYRIPAKIGPRSGGL